MDKKVKDLTQQGVNLKPGFRLIENRVIKPGFRIITEGRKDPVNNKQQETQDTEKEGESTANEWKKNRSRRQKRRERREAAIKEM